MWGATSLSRTNSADALTVTASVVRRLVVPDPSGGQRQRRLVHHGGSSAGAEQFESHSPVQIGSCKSAVRLKVKPEPRTSETMSRGNVLLFPTDGDTRATHIPLNPRHALALAPCPALLPCRYKTADRDVVLQAGADREAQHTRGAARRVRYSTHSGDTGTAHLSLWRSCRRYWHWSTPFASGSLRSSGRRRGSEHQTVAGPLRAGGAQSSSRATGWSDCRAYW